MEELNELLEKDQRTLDEINEKLKKFLNEFPVLNLKEDILLQMNISVINSLDKLLDKISLSKESKEKVKKSFQYYKFNQDLNLADLLVRDKKCLDFIETIKVFYKNAMLYKIRIVTNYRVEINDYTKNIEILKSIKELLENKEYISEDKLTNLLKNTSLSKDSVAKIIEINKQRQKKELDNISKEKMNLEQIEDAIRKINYYLLNLVQKTNKDASIYLFQSSLVDFKDKLIALREDYELSLQMLNDESFQDKDYLKETLLETTKEIETSLLQFKKLIDEYEQKNNDDINNSEIENEEKKRDLLFLAPVLKDINNYRKGDLEPKLIKKLYTMLRHLENSEKISMINYSNELASLPIYEIKNAEVKIYYHLINGKIVVLLISEPVHDNYSAINNVLASRTNKKTNIEYKQLLNSLDLSTSKSLEKSLEPTMTNQEYGEKLLDKYRERSEEFWNVFNSECYNPESKMR